MPAVASATLTGLATGRFVLMFRRLRFVITKVTFVRLGFAQAALRLVRSQKHRPHHRNIKKTPQ